MHKKGKVYTRKLIAQILDLSEKRVKQLTEDGTIPEHSDGHYKLLPVIQGYIKYLQSQIADDDTASDYNVEKAKLTRLKREDAELDLQLRRNELHKAHIIEFTVTNMIIAFKAKLEVLPYKILPALMNIPDDDDRADKSVAVMKEAISEALGELLEYDPRHYDEKTYLTGPEGEE